MIEETANLSYENPNAPSLDTNPPAIDTAISGTEKPSYSSAKPDLPEVSAPETSPETVAPVEAPLPEILSDVPEPVSAWPTLTPQRIEECKVLNQGRPIYRYEQHGIVIVYTGLLGSAYKELTDKFRAEATFSTPERQDEMTAEAAVLWPRLPEGWFETALAGHAQTLALLVRQQSGFSLTTSSGRIIGKNLKTEEIDPQTRPTPAEPTDLEIQTIRAQSPGQQLFLATFPDGDQNLFIPLPRIEWTSINKRLELDPALDAAVEVTRFCVKWPAVPNWDQELAGKINALFDKIMTHSAFDLEPQVVEL